MELTWGAVVELRARSEPNQQAHMTEKPTLKREALVWFDSLDEMPTPEPLSNGFKALTD